MADWKQLETDIYKATKAAFRELAERSRPEPLCAFALYIDEGAMTVCPAANTPAHLAKMQNANPDFPADFTFSPAEWAYEAEGADDQFDVICGQLSARLDEMSADESVFETFRDRLSDTCFQVLKTLKAENFFEAIAGRSVLLLFAVSDSDITLRHMAIVRELNGTAIGDAYEQWARTFTKL